MNIIYCLFPEYVEKPTNTGNFNDRADTRRKKVGSSHHSEKTQAASLNQSIPSENKGFKMLSKLGWSEGQSLGKTNEGITEPVSSYFMIIVILK